MEHAARGDMLLRRMQSRATYTCTRCNFEKFSKFVAYKNEDLEKPLCKPCYQEILSDAEGKDAEDKGDEGKGAENRGAEVKEGDVGNAAVKDGEAGVTETEDGEFQDAQVNDGGP